MASSEYKELFGIRHGTVSIEGMLELPPDPIGVVLFGHGSGSSRLSPRNNQVAAFLRERGMGTLLIDLLTPQEDREYEMRFDIDLLTRRLDAAARWLHTHSRTAGMPIGLFGASTGAAAALELAASLHDAPLRDALRDDIAAVVSRGGRPDLAAQAALEQVEVPTLLIVGELDHVVVDLNRAAYLRLRCAKRLEIVYGATHLFQEPGALEQVAELAANWFRQYFAAPAKETMRPPGRDASSERRTS
jgi:putative phosphoribosyl transferase